MSDAFTKLKHDYPEFVVRNRTTVAREIVLMGGDTVQVGPDGQAKLDAAQLMQLPDFRLFEMVSPDVKALIKYGLIGEGKPKPTPKTKPTAPGEGVASPSHSGKTDDLGLPGADHPSLNP